MKLTKKVWVIMDKERKAIACGVPRNRSMRMLDKALDTRILTYQSKGKAEAGFKVSGFYDETERTDKDDYWSTYLRNTYGEKVSKEHVNGDVQEYIKMPDESEYLEAVEAEITIEL